MQYVHANDKKNRKKIRPTFRAGNTVRKLGHPSYFNLARFITNNICELLTSADGSAAHITPKIEIKTEIYLI